MFGIFTLKRYKLRKAIVSYVYYLQYFIILLYTIIAEVIKAKYFLNDYHIDFSTAA